MALKRNIPKQRKVVREYPKRGFDIGTWIVPTLGFVMFAYAMLFMAIYTMRVGGPNVSLYTAQEQQIKAPQSTNVGQVLQGISDAFDPNKK